jgi:hypothetical protein
MERARPDDDLRRVLGSPEPEMLCDECFEKLDEYVELELELSGARADERVPGMRPHLDGCPACRDEYESLRELASR